MYRCQTLKLLKILKKKINKFFKLINNFKKKQQFHKFKRERDETDKNRYMDK